MLCIKSTVRSSCPRNADHVSFKVLTPNSNGLSSWGSFRIGSCILQIEGLKRSKTMSGAPSHAPGVVAPDVSAIEIPRVLRFRLCSIYIILLHKSIVRDVKYFNPILSVACVLAVRYHCPYMTIESGGIEHHHKHNESTAVAPEHERVEAKERKIYTREEIEQYLRDLGLSEEYITGSEEKGIPAIGQVMWDKLLLLNKVTPTFGDEVHAVGLYDVLVSMEEIDDMEDHARKFPVRILELKPHIRRLPPKARSNFIMGTFGTDIGKAGPAELSEDYLKLFPLVQDENETERLQVLSEAIARLYGVDKAGIVNSPILDEAREVFGEGCDDLLGKLDAFLRFELKRHKGIDKGTEPLVMSDLYDLHPFWSLQILKHSGFTREALQAVGAHHVLEGNFSHDMFASKDVIDENGTSLGVYSTGEILNEDGSLSGRFLDRDELLVLLMDKYDAQRTRGIVH